jgi:hypothetical protein
MSTKHLVFLLWFSALSASGQKARFRDIALKEDGVELKFPVVMLPDSVISERINAYLQINMLYQTTVKAPGSKVFSRIKWTPQQSGLDELDYTVLMNNGKILSFLFDGEGMGAHPSPFQTYYQFDMQSGYPILAEQLFTQEGLLRLDEDIRGKRNILISKHMKELPNDTAKDDALDSSDLEFIKVSLNGCDTGEEHSHLSIVETGLEFHTGQCLPHLIEGADEDLVVRYSPQQLGTWLSDYGNDLILARRNGRKARVKTDSTSLALVGEPMNGTVGKYAIVMQLESAVAWPGQEVLGFYYYESRGIKIGLSGYFKDNVLTLKETDDAGEVTGTFSGTFENGIYSGTWTNPKTKKTLPFVVKGNIEYLL